MAQLFETIRRRWLALLILAMGIWTLTPWLAPLFMHWGWTVPGRLIYMLYAAFCHQMPQRSWFFFGPKLSYSLAEIQAVWLEPATVWGLRGLIGTTDMGWKLAWSDRMVSFYGGFFLFSLLYALLREPVRRSNWPMSWRWLPVLLLPLALDGITHMVSDLAGMGVGFRETNAWPTRAQPTRCRWSKITWTAAVTAARNSNCCWPVCRPMPCLPDFGVRARLVLASIEGYGIPQQVKDNEWRGLHQRSVGSLNQGDQ